MSPWLFNIYMDGVVKEVNDESPLLRFGFGDGRRLRLKYVRYCEHMTQHWWHREEKVARLAEEFRQVCRRKLKDNVEKDKEVHQGGR